MQGTLTVTVGANNPPVGVVDSNSVTESGTGAGNVAIPGTPSASGNVLSNDTDPDAADTKTVAQVNGAPGNVGSTLSTTYGTLNIAANGSYTYTLDNTRAATQALTQGQVATEVFTYRVRDAAGLFSDTTLTVTVNGTNDIPVAVADTATTPLNVPLLNIDVKANDTDVDNTAAQLTVSNPVLANPAQGSVSLNADGTLNFTPASGVSGAVLINYTLTDATGASVQGTLTVTVTTLPTFSITDVTVNEGSGTISFTVTKSGATALTTTVDYAVAPNSAVTPGDYAAGTSPLAGTLSFVAGVTTQTIVLNIIDDAVFELTETFNVNLSAPTNAAIADNLGVGTITDNDAAPSFAINDVSVSEAAGTVTFTVTKTGAANVASSVTYTAADASALTPGDYAAGTSPLSGVLNFAAGVTTQTIVLNITNDAVAELTETFNVNLSAAVNATISDSQGVATIADDDGAPAFSINDVTVNEGSGTISFTVTKSGATALTTTVDYAVAPNSAVTPGDYAAGTSPLAGTLSFVAGVTTQTIVLNIIDDAVFELTETFNVNLSAPTNAAIADNLGVGTITDNDGAPNTPPVANSDSLTMIEDTPISLSPTSLIGNDSDLDGDPLTIISVQGASNGTVAMVGGNVVFTPSPNFSGPASFTYTISDGRGGTSTATVNLTVLPVNDPPVAVDDSGPSTLEDTPVTVSVASLLGNDFDIEGDPLTITSVQSGVGGSVSLAGGVITFSPSPNFNGPATFTYTVSDGKGGLSTASVSINVTAVNDPPVAANDLVATNEDQPVTLNPLTLLGNDVDVDGNPLAITSVQGATNGSIALVNGTIVFTPTPNFNGSASFTYTIADGSGGTSTATVNVTVISVNDIPVSNDDKSVDTFEDTPLIISTKSLLENDTDVDGDPLVITSVQGAVNGTVSLIAGAIVFTPAPGFDGPASFTYTVGDGHGGTSTSRVILTIQGVNNSPVAETFIGLTDALRPNVPEFTTIADPALHVLFSLSDVRSEIDLRGDRGIFQTDSVTLAELSSGLRSDLAFSEGNQFGSRGLGGTRTNIVKFSNALFVQQSVRHQSLGLEQGLFVHDAVWSSQLESLARAIRIESFNSAVPGVATLLDGFALAVPSPAAEAETGDSRQVETGSRIASIGEVESDRDVEKNSIMRNANNSDGNGNGPGRRNGADGFGVQLQRSAAAFKPRISHPAVRPSANSSSPA